ncbi:MULTISPECIES: TonB-dependent receptor [unclassified Janthinobacterium]|uniref:TonB-dependent receptor n=1 Tax=unclassified Janthinobacterium TaxID=2610881 RepID=UPI00161B55BB|nr:MULTISPECIES: TonB-dependent receptor [unclassified Janthinobacterium]MBB5370905.1 iron complex outermembrane receptor protein [Janthinobacterium sp. K2C7]MBB5383711.1 iron complex outermembrane receptor protein [Janthinobacterium sp. K2Li3]MBB5388216.1 iron complex outermembrane receptor protein [Janthinobacterium sp. K2E3]
MMIEKLLSRSLRVICASGLLLGMHAAGAQSVTDNSTDDSASMQRVEVTGSSIKRLSSQTALPITSIKADDFIKQGLTTAQDVMNTIPMNQSSQGSSQSVGLGTGGQSVADLRGLGSDKTLVLLNGRRIASHPFNGSSVDLNIIPLSALDRVEILRDGASAIYGTDAIGGVINFITKRSVQGATVSVEGFTPTKSGGGEESRINLTGGYGDLNKDGYNVFGVADLHKQSALSAISRGFSDTSLIPSKGVDRTSGTSQPANFFADNGLTGNPYFATGCQGPGLVANSKTGTCRTDTTTFIDDIPKTQQESFLGKATFKLNEDNTASVEYLHARSSDTTAIAASPLIGISMPSTSPYYPGNGNVPGVAGLNGSDLTLNWRTVAAGKREGYDTSISDRLVLSSEGLVAGWDYDVGFNYSISKAASAFVNGYTNDSQIMQGVANGILNPFGDQSAAGTAYIDAAQLHGQYLGAKMTSTGVDAKISRDIYQLPAGAVGFAVGTEFRHDKADYDVNTALASQAQSSGYADAQNQSGQRNIAALFSELSVPLRKDLDLSLAARYDHYDDVGSSFNPKVGFRWQPTKQVLFRTSYNTGFRAPTLYDLHGPATTTFTGDSYNDPKLCPGGTAVPGANANVVCNQQQNIRSGGNINLKPEKSKTFAFGVVLEPVNAVTLSFDYFNIKIRDKIGTVAEQTLFGNYAKYQQDFVYSADGNTLQYVNANLTNLGEVHTSGVDTSLTWRLPHSNTYGDFGLQFDGTWVHNYEYQNETGGAYIQNVGVYADNNPVFRWKHNASLNWSKGKWGASLSNQYMSGYEDQNLVDAQYQQHVKAYSTFSLSGSYKGFHNTDISVGVKNLFDTNPPFTNQGTVFQTGYDPRYTDPLGRTLYVKASYKF